MASSLKVTHKLVLSFLCIALLVGGLGYLAHTLSGWVGASIGTSGQEQVEAAHGIARAVAGTQLALHDVIGTAQAAEAAVEASEEEEASDLEAQAVSAREALASRTDAFDRQIAAMRAAGADDLGTLQQTLATYVGHAERIAALSESAPAEAATTFRTEVEPFYLSTLAPLLDERVDAAEAILAEQTARAATVARWSGWIGMGAALLVALAIGALGFFLIRFIAASLRALTDVAHAIREGRYDDRVEIDSNDEIGLLGGAINEMIDQFATTTVSKAYVENIVQSMADPLIVVNPLVKIAMVNQAALDLLGYEREELLGKPVMTIFAQTGRNRGAVIKQTIEQGLTGNVETSFKARPDREVPVSLSSALVREGTEVLGLVIVAKDITQQKQFETELIEAKEKAEQMVHLRDAFLANMSHEIRTPLTGILGSAQVLAEGLEGDHRNLAKIIEDAGTRLLDTINSVLEMARIEAGEVQPEVEILNLQEEAEASAQVLRHVADKKGLHLKVQAAAGNIFAQIDRSCLHRILNNLVGNAVKFTREGMVSVEIEANADYATLTVRDTGVGISKEFLPHLFDDFKQESTGLKRSHEGSGLGLAITKKLVEMMGGEISVESIKGIGSAFSVTFPRVPFEQVPADFAETSRPAPKPASTSKRYPWDTEEAGASDEPTFEPPPAPADRARRDILLIEDNAQNAYMAKFMLQDYETDIATTPEDAVEAVLHNQYRVLLVDINLGADRSGIDLLHEIRGVEGYELVRAVAVTAYALPGDEDRFLGEGFDDYVAKPFKKETLLAALERMFEADKEVESAPNLESILDGSFEDPDTQLFDDTLLDIADVPQFAPEHTEPLDEPLDEPFDGAFDDTFVEPDALSGDGASGAHQPAGG